MNGSNRDAGTALGKLMHDFFCTDPDDMHYDELASKVRYYKEDEKGVATMCKAMEDMRNEAAIAAERRKTIEIVHSSLEEGLPYEVIARITQLTVDQVKEIAGQKSA